MSMDKGVMKMRPLENGLAIEPGKTVKLTPGGDHFMMMKEPDQEGRQAADHAGVREGRQGAGVPRRRGRAGTDCLSQFWHQEGHVRYVARDEDVRIWVEGDTRRQQSVGLRWSPSCRED
jgi:hypothetical protein